MKVGTLDCHSREVYSFTARRKEFWRLKCFSAACLSKYYHCRSRVEVRRSVRNGHLMSLSQRVSVKKKNICFFQSPALQNDHFGHHIASNKTHEQATPCFMESGPSAKPKSAFKGMPFSYFFYCFFYHWTALNQNNTQAQYSPCGSVPLIIGIFLESPHQ